MLIKLNDEQEEVVKDRENNILLTAIPGSGKTRTIVYKIIEDLN
jgi:superfamily I DNA/RNA helicase